VRPRRNLNTPFYNPDQLPGERGGPWSKRKKEKRGKEIHVQTIHDLPLSTRLAPAQCPPQEKGKERKGKKKKNKPPPDRRTRPLPSTRSSTPSSFAGHQRKKRKRKPQRTFTLGVVSGAILLWAKPNSHDYCGHGGLWGEKKKKRKEIKTVIAPDRHGRPNDLPTPHPPQQSQKKKREKLTPVPRL